MAKPCPSNVWISKLLLYVDSTFMDLDKTLKTTNDLNLPKSSISTLILKYFKAIKRLSSTQ